MVSGATFGTRTYELGAWVRADLSVSDGPHKLVESLDWNDAGNQYGVVWADAAHTVPLMVQDGDGCQAAILWPASPSKSDTTPMPGVGET